MSEDGNWYDGITPDNEENTAAREQLAKFDNAGAYIEHVNGLENKDWRDDFAGDDDKFKSTLERFATPGDMSKAYREAQATISSGRYKEVPGEGATDDDIKAYREANGIPLESSGYMDNLPDGMVIGEDDKELMTDFMGVLHGMNVDPKVGHEVIKWYNKFSEEQQDVIAETDSTQHQETEDALRTAWGSDYRANINLVGAILESSFGKEAKEQLMSGRFADGRAFMNDPKVLEGFAEISRKLNPLTQLTPPGGDPQKTLNDEIADIEKYMSDDRTKYFKDQPAQDRLKQLYEIRLKHDETHKAA